MLKPFHHNVGAPAKGVNTMPASLLFVVVWLSEARFASRRRVPAQGLVEYSMIILFVAIVVIAIVTIVGRTTCATWWLKLVNNSAWGTATPETC
jgi:Flp pilus assembly pilin Flp